MRLSSSSLVRRCERKSAGQRLRQRSFSFSLSHELLGHKDVKTTMIYTHCSIAAGEAYGALWKHCNEDHRSDRREKCGATPGVTAFRFGRSPATAVVITAAPLSTLACQRTVLAGFTRYRLSRASILSGLTMLYKTPSDLRTASYTGVRAAFPLVRPSDVGACNVLVSTMLRIGYPRVPWL